MATAGKLLAAVAGGMWLVTGCAARESGAQMGASSAAVAGSPARLVESFDTGWKFVKEDVADGPRVSLDDSAWKSVRVPHDWSIEGPFDRENATGGAGGFLPAGIGWYRKHFALPAADAGRRIFVEFDGVMANSDVYINGVKLGHRPYGYVSFRYELTGNVTFGKGNENVLAVRVDDSAQPASRWYAGAGINRHVRLIVTEPVHVGQWATFVSTPEVSAERAKVHVVTGVVNQGEKAASVAVRFQVLDATGKRAGTAEAAPRQVPVGGTEEFAGDIEIAKPQLWDLDRPHMYQLVADVRTDGKPVDEDRTSFGIREAKFEPDTGFWLNGKNVKIKGMCLHGDASALGTAVPLSAWQRRLERLKQMGVNAIRTAHNPPAPEFLDLCDRMGFLVMDEMFDCWEMGKNPYDYHLYFDAWSLTDTRDTVRRDRNHPSIILWSAGNEIRDTHRPDEAKRILSGLVAEFHKEDSTRPVTQALFRPNVTGDYHNGLADILDVVGQNYREREILAAHAQKPTRKIVGTENGHDLDMWLACRDHPEYSGQFVWTGIDYLGESRGWPVVANNAGMLDRTGMFRPVGFQRQSWWSETPMVHVTRRVAHDELAPTDPGYEAVQQRRPKVLFDDWTPKQTGAHEERVEVYSNCPVVELKLNGKSLGQQPKPADDSPRVWKVAFEPGRVEAIGRDPAGKVVAHDELRTAGKPAAVRLVPEEKRIRPQWDNVAYVRAEVVDANGVVVPDAADEITFGVDGPAQIIAVDSADNASHEPFEATKRKAFEGRCFAIVRASGDGTVRVKAGAPGLRGGEAEIQVGK